MRNSILFASAILFSISTGWAQETPPIEQEEKKGSSFEQRMVIAASADDGEGPAKIQFFSTSGDGVMGDAVFLAEPMLGGIGPVDPFSLVDNQSVQKEIELVEEQLQQLRDIRDNFNKQISEQLGDLTNGGFDPERGRQIKDLVTDFNQQRQQQMEQILLPHQLERLKQIALQTQMQRSGNVETITGKQVAEALGITDEQKQELQERAKEIKEKLEAKIARLKEEAKQELLDELTSEQRRKLEEMTGAKFELKPENWRDRIRNRRRAQDDADR